MTQKRIWLFDNLRGLSLLLMLIYHLLFDLVYFFGVRIPFFWADWFTVPVAFIGFTFTLVAGAVRVYSRSNLRRGLWCILCAAVITGVTLILFPDCPDWFGVLWLQGICILLYPLLRPLVRKIPPIWGLVGSLVLFFCLYNLPYGYLFWGPIRVSLPRWLYSSRFLFPLGLPHPGFLSLDYFPLIPWFFCFLAGCFLGELARASRLPDWCSRPHLPFLSRFGRHTLFIYMVHQPIIFGLLYLFFFLFAPGSLPQAF